MDRWGDPTREPDPRDWDANTYDRVSGPMALWGASVLARMPLRGDETVLDAGCGPGRVTGQLLERLPAGRVIALYRNLAAVLRPGGRLVAQCGPGRSRASRSVSTSER